MQIHDSVENLIIVLLGQVFFILLARLGGLSVSGNLLFGRNQVFHLSVGGLSRGVLCGAGVFWPFLQIPKGRRVDGWLLLYLPGVDRGLVHHLAVIIFHVVIEYLLDIDVRRGLGCLGGSTL